MRDLCTKGKDEGIPVRLNASMRAQTKKAEVQCL